MVCSNTSSSLWSPCGLYSVLPYGYSALKPANVTLTKRQGGATWSKSVKYINSQQQQQQQLQQQQQQQQQLQQQQQQHQEQQDGEYYYDDEEYYEDFNQEYYQQYPLYRPDWENSTTSLSKSRLQAPVEAIEPPPLRSGFIGPEEGEVLRGVGWLEQEQEVEETFQEESILVRASFFGLVLPGILGSLFFLGMPLVQVSFAGASLVTSYFLARRGKAFIGPGQDLELAFGDVLATLISSTEELSDQAQGRRLLGSLPLCFNLTLLEDRMAGCGHQCGALANQGLALGRALGILLGDC